ncbi:MAG: matrixin family metalloprotease [Candidatus Portnoybacteria bacterium]|nr:matrixin family metalloprotease [Candidatus Portnoybacteria bacterium]
MKKIVFASLIGLFSVFVGIAIAQALVFIPAQVAPSGVSISVPDVAVNNSPALEPLEPGTLEKIVFIHYANGKIVANATAPTCYKLLGVKWKSLPVSYVVNPEVEAIVSGAIFSGNETWDVATSKELFNDNYSLDTTANWDSDYPDGRNEYSMGNYPQDGVIAVTVVWSGVPLGSKGRQIIDFDVMFDTDFIWGDAATSTSAVMDLQNIAVHESGHGVGFGDIYSSSCSEVTMYGYSNYGETKKRTLERPDIIGLQKMYGL